MALIKDNDLTEGMSGKFGNKFVFRIVKGVTVATRRPTKERTFSEKQRAHFDRFRDATSYAKVTLLNPASKEYYDRRAGDKAFANAFAAAVKDYLVLPEITHILAHDTTGSPGTLLIQAKDNDKIIRMQVTITNTDDEVIESGEATYVPSDTAWRYNTLSTLDQAKVVVTAIDRPGNKTTFEKWLQ